MLDWLSQNPYISPVEKLFGILVSDINEKRKCYDDQITIKIYWKKFPKILLKDSLISKMIKQLKIMVVLKLNLIFLIKIVIIRTSYMQGWP